MQVFFEESNLDQTTGIRCGQNNADAPCSLCFPHWHDAYEVLYIRRGAGRQQLNADMVSVQTGDVIIISPGDVHATDAVASAGCDVDVIQFDAAAFGQLPSGVYQIRDAKVYDIFDALLQCEADTRPGRQLRMTGLIFLLCGMLLAEVQRKDLPVCSGAIREITAYMEQAEDLRLEQIAARFGYSPEHLSRKFRAELDVSYRVWCERLRMRRAVKLLHDDRLSIANIAEQLGYSDASSFIRAFKHLYGVTPSQYGRLILPMGQ